MDVPAHSLPTEAVRDWRLAKLGIPPQVADELSAVRLDWLLAVDNTHNAVEQALSERAGQ